MRVGFGPWSNRSMGTPTYAVPFTLSKFTSIYRSEVFRIKFSQEENLLSWVQTLPRSKSHMKPIWSPTGDLANFCHSQKKKYTRTVDATKARDRMNPVSLKVTKFSK